MEDSPTILIVSDDPAFSRDLIGRWQLERSVPGFTVMSPNLLSNGASGNFDLAITGPQASSDLSPVLTALDCRTHPVICVVAHTSQAQAVRTEHHSVLVVQQHEAWLDFVMVLGMECLRRVSATRRLRQAQRTALASNNAAVLGRYMLDHRHDFSNLLTSMLGNAELLLDEGDTLAEPARDQLRTIHDTALHIHEIMQRFSSLALEMQMAEKSSHDETAGLSHVPASVG